MGVHPAALWTDAHSERLPELLASFVLKRPKKRLLKAKAVDRDAFVASYARLRIEAQANGAKIFLVDEAHFRAIR